MSNYNNSAFFIVLAVLLNSTILVVFALNNNINCIQNSNDFKCEFSSISPYRFVANYNDSEIQFAGCEAKKIWLLIRHGTRFPSKKNIALMDGLPDIQKNILNYCQNNPMCYLKSIKYNLNLLADWKLNMTLKNQAMILAEEGKREMIGLGERYQSRFPQLMPEKYENTIYRFKYTDNQRTKESANYFSIGLFGKDQSNKVQYIKAANKDPVLRFYKMCDKWQRDVDDNPEAYLEFEEFKKSNIINKMTESISHRIGIDVDFDTVKAIRAMCAFETAWNEILESVWCPMLILDDFKVMEYADDLKYYWKDGYGYPITAEQTCPAFIDMFNFFESNDNVKTSAYFTHSGTLLKILSRLGIANDAIPLRHNLYESSEDRVWKTSTIDTFATNVAFIFYHCESIGPSILTMHQERIVNLAGCPENKPCPLSIMEEKYPDKREECEFEKICSV